MRESDVKGLRLATHKIILYVNARGFGLGLLRSFPDERCRFQSSDSSGERAIKYIL